MFIIMDIRNYEGFYILGNLYFTSKKEAVDYINKELKEIEYEKLSIGYEDSYVNFGNGDSWEIKEVNLHLEGDD